VQASGLSTTVKSDVWAEAEDALRTVLGCNIPRASSGAAARAAASTSANASRADVSHPSDVSSADRMRGVDGCANGRALTINQMSGTILARGMPSELRTVDNLLKSMQISISRQVIIESKIIDVELSKDSQQGINWGLFHNGQHLFSVGANAGSLGVNQPSAITGQSGGTVANSVTLGNLLGATVSSPNAFSARSGMAIQSRNFAALINFLESQGRVHVLSSPRIATMNNQKAILKVGSEEPFVTNITGGTATVAQAGSATVLTQPSLVYQPFFSGISLDVTPQIDAEDNITLHVHSMVNNVVEKSKIALPDQTTMVPFAVNTMNETDSVVKAKDGQVIVIGGLMTERTSDTRGGIPGAGDLPLVGGLFNWGVQTKVKRELVILLKPTMVKDEFEWANDIEATRERLGGPR
jgi:MSHA biogenesis protein MshL